MMNIKNILLNKQTIPDRIFDIVNTVAMISLALLCTYPLWYCIIGAFNEGKDYLMGGVLFLPRKLTLENFAAVLQNDTLARAYGVTIARTIIGTIAHVVFTALFAYGFSKNELKFRSVYAALAIGTMYFGGGLIPTYLLYDKLGLLDRFSAYIIPECLVSSMLWCFSLSLRVFHHPCMNLRKLMEPVNTGYYGVSFYLFQSLYLQRLHYL